MKKHILMIFMFFFLLGQSFSAQWISFDGTAKADKPNIEVLISNNSTVLIEISLPGMEIAKRTEDSITFDVLRIPEYFTTLEIGKPQFVKQKMNFPKKWNLKFPTLTKISFITHNCSLNLSVNGRRA